MEKTIAADFIEQVRNGYVLLALPSAELQDRINALLVDLAENIGETLWLAPSNSLHITLCEIIQPKAYGEDRGLLYKRHEREYHQLPATVLATVEPIKVHFNTIEVSPQAVIVRGDDAGVFNKIRVGLTDVLPLPPETKRPPDIVHISIARYTEAIPLDPVKKAAQMFTIDFHETVSEFHLVHNLRSPLLDYDILRTYQLAKH